MPFTFTMPKLSPTMTSGSIAKWHKKAGDHVAAGELLIEISTDKATVEHNALDEGYLRKILAKEGEEVAVNQPLAIFSETKDESIASYTPEAVQDVSPTPTAGRKSTVQAAAAVQANQAPAPARAVLPPQFVPPPRLAWEAPSKQASDRGRVAASPLARKLAQEQGLDLSSVRGSGPGQRVMSRDLSNAQPLGASALGQRELPTHAPGSYEEVPLTQMRKVIARRLQESKSTIPHFYLRHSVDAEGIIAARRQLETAGIKITYNDFVVRACALALRAYPEVNSGFNPDSNAAIRYRTVDISVAVSIAEGLITPIVRHADFKPITEISGEIRSLAQRAKEGELKPEEYVGGSFTVSNMGMYGIDDFVAVINPPQAAILAVGAIQNVPVVRQGSLVPGKQMVLVLSSDHRVIDGALAAQFMRKVSHYLENTSLLLI